MDNLQFYPTPPTLARRAWKKFKNTDFAKVLEPSAGKGDLALACPENGRSRKVVLPDCCEIDITKHPIIREKGLNVVGFDFMQFSTGSIYSHIIMNPPFADGAKHVLKAWDILWDGEIVAIINAETLRNAYSKERQLLVNIIAQHGEAEFLTSTFAVPDAERKTDVDVALVYLRKQANVSEDIIGPILDELKRDSTTEETLAGDYREAAELALPNSLVENSVAAFNAAVRSMREAVVTEARAQYYANLLGDTMAARNGDAGRTSPSDSVEYVRNTIGKRYLELKDRAWAGILRSANVTSHLSSAAQKRVEREFEEIKQFEFTVLSIYGFLCGIVESQGKIQIDMACDVFDLITKYHTDNTVFYKGWKSNDKHRTCGMQVKTTRFILPGHSTESWQSNVSWGSEQLLRDFDKVFAMLDGKLAPVAGLGDLFRGSFQELCHGKRLSSSYFDVRYYPGAGTIHFFPSSKTLVGRLNLLVGRHRQWLPPVEARVSEAFWLQYEGADKFDKEIRAEIDKRARETKSWNHPLNSLYRSGDDELKTQAEAVITDAISAVLERHGIDEDFQLDDGQKDCLLLEAA
jgi:hypothetical protein